MTDFERRTWTQPWCDAREGLISKVDQALARLDAAQQAQP